MQTKLWCINSTSLDLASEWKNSARWHPSQAVDLPDLPPTGPAPSTTHPDASFSGDLEGSWRPGGQVCLYLGYAHPLSRLTFPGFALPLPSALLLLLKALSGEFGVVSLLVASCTPVKGRDGGERGRDLSVLPEKRVNEPNSNAWAGLGWSGGREGKRHFSLSQTSSPERARPRQAFLGDGREQEDGLRPLGWLPL